MALPYEGESEFGRQGQYELTGNAEEIRPLSINNRRDSENTYQFNQRMNQGAPPPKNSIFPRCFSSVPAVFLYILAILLILLAIFSIPLIFVMTQSAQQVQHQTLDEENSDLFPDGEGGEFRSENETIASLAGLMPKNVTLCRGMGFSCANHPSIMISTNSRCDGFADCPDGSDELDCKECTTSFSCLRAPNSTNSSSLLCLRAPALFDGRDHCPDQSDELVIKPVKNECAADKLKCSSMCLPKEFMCDGERHCPSGEDERNCEGKCRNGSKYCKASNKCLPKWSLCNGVKDCEDGSDEDDCDCKQCSGKGKALCKSSSNEKGFCMNADRVCDGFSDCPNGEDEDGCPGELKLDEAEAIKCNDGKTYSKVYACLGLIPACQGLCDECNKNSAFDCGNKNCILKSKVCDGVNDCPSGLDEMNCTCPATSFECSSPLPNGNKKCIEQSQKCDGFIDCPNGEDENDCEKCSNDDAFKCKSESKCIAQTARCDGRNQCADGSDEVDCSAEKCAIHPLSMYLCNDGKSCFRKDEVCKPYSRCPNLTRVDNGYCILIRRSLFLL